MVLDAITTMGESVSLLSEGTQRYTARTMDRIEQAQRRIAETYRAVARDALAEACHAAAGWHHVLVRTPEGIEPLSDALGRGAWLSSLDVVNHPFHADWHTVAVAGTVQDLALGSSVTEHLNELFRYQVRVQLEQRCPELLDEMLGDEAFLSAWQEENLLPDGDMANPDDVARWIREWLSARAEVAVTAAISEFGDERLPLSAAQRS